MTRVRDVMSHNMRPGRKSQRRRGEVNAEDQPFCITLLGAAR
jgi:hypothetical protein